MGVIPHRQFDVEEWDGADSLQGSPAPVPLDAILELECRLEPDFVLDSFAGREHVDEVGVEAWRVLPGPEELPGVVEVRRIGRERQVERVQDVMRRRRSLRHSSSRVTVELLELLSYSARLQARW